MISFRKFVFVTGLWAGMELMLTAQVGGTSTYEFLNLTNSARAASLGGRPISLNDNDLNLIFVNPSLLTSDMHNHIALNYNSYYANIGFGYAVYSFKVPNIGSFALGAQYVNYGSFPMADYLGNLSGSFKASDLAINTIFSRNVDSIFRVGITFKTIVSNYERYTSIGVATDIGLIYYFSEQSLSAALVIRNLGTQIKTYTASNFESLPFEIEVGISKKLAHAPFRFSITAHNLQRYHMLYDSDLMDNTFINNEKTNTEKFFDNLFRHIIGSIEFLPSKTFYIAGAFNYQRRMELGLTNSYGLVGFSFGAGIRTQKFALSYGQSVYHAAGGTQQFSIWVNLSTIRQNN